MKTSSPTEHWPDIAAQLLKIGATAYGGPAIMGVMQAELQEKREWVSSPDTTIPVTRSLLSAVTRS